MPTKTKYSAIKIAALARPAPSRRASSKTEATVITISHAVPNFAFPEADPRPMTKAGNITPPARLSVLLFSVSLTRATPRWLSPRRAWRRARDRGVEARARHSLLDPAPIERAWRGGGVSGVSPTRHETPDQASWLTATD